MSGVTNHIRNGSKKRLKKNSLNFESPDYFFYAVELTYFTSSKLTSVTFSSEVVEEEESAAPAAPASGAPSAC